MHFDHTLCADQFVRRHTPEWLLCIKRLCLRVTSAHTFVQVLQDLEQYNINSARRFRLQFIVTRCGMTESLK